MIPYQELERALQRWKARQAGGPEEAPVESSGESVIVDSVSVESSYEEAEAESAFPSQNAGTNEIVFEGDAEENN